MMIVEAHHPTMRNWLLPNATTADGGRKNERLTPSPQRSVVSHLPPSPPPCAGRSANFTIAEILKPDFAQNVLTDTKKSRDNIKQIVSTESRFGHGSYGQEAVGVRGCLKVSSSVSHKHRPHAELAKGPYHSKSRQAEKPAKKPTSTELNFGERNRHFSSQSSTSRTCSVPCSPLSPPPTPSSPSASESGSEKSADDKLVWPAWVYCTRYSDRPSAGPRSRKIKRKDRPSDEKRPRTAFTTEQLVRLKKEFDENRYLTEDRRKNLAQQLDLNESQIKIWFQNKRAKLKKTQGSKSKLASELITQGLYNHATVGTDSGDEL